MNKEPINWKDYHHQIYQIYHGMIALTLVPFALLFLEWDSGEVLEEINYSGFYFILISQLIWPIGFTCWYVWKGEKVRYAVVEGASLDEKLREFKKINLYKYLMLALAGCLAALAMWLQPSFIFVIAYLAVLVQYSFLRPSEDKIVRDMRLTKSERQQMHESA